MSYAAVSLEDMAFPTYQKQKQEVLIFLELQSAEGLEEEYQCQINIKDLTQTAQKQLINIHKKDRYPCSQELKKTTRYGKLINFIFGLLSF